MSTPLGLILNNPGNIRDQGIKWDGLNGSVQGFCRFVKPYYGIRALAKDLHTKWAKDGLRTVEQIVEKFAPPAENDTAGYKVFVRQFMGIPPNTQLNLNEFNQAFSLTRAVMTRETGKPPYPMTLIAEAVEDGIYPPVPKASE